MGSLRIGLDRVVAYNGLVGFYGLEPSDALRRGTTPLIVEAHNF